jgi:hypothetical protein
VRKAGVVLLACVGCYSETIGPYVTDVVSKDKSHVVTRCGINLDHGLFGGVSPSKGNRQVATAVGGIK